MRPTRPSDRLARKELETNGLKVKTSFGAPVCELQNGLIGALISTGLQQRQRCGAEQTENMHATQGPSRICQCTSPDFKDLMLAAKCLAIGYRARLWSPRSRVSDMSIGRHIAYERPCTRVLQNRGVYKTVRTGAKIKIDSNARLNSTRTSF